MVSAELGVNLPKWLAIPRMHLLKVVIVYNSVFVTEFWKTV